jgi:hypothetical protein
LFYFSDVVLLDVVRILTYGTFLCKLDTVIFCFFYCLLPVACCLLPVARAAKARAASKKQGPRRKSKGRAALITLTMAATFACARKATGPVLCILISY